MEWERAQALSFLFMNTRADRLNRLREAMALGKLHGLLISHLPNIYYLAGFSGTSGVLAISQDGVLFCTDGRYRLQAREEVRQIPTRIGQDAAHEAATWFVRSGARRIGFEASHLTYAVAVSLKERHPRLQWTAGQGWVEGLRETKDENELAAMRKAARLISSVARDVMPIIRPGMREEEVAAEIDCRIRRAGGEVAFGTIVASGRRSAYPHGRASPKPIGKNELVVVDLGAILGHYCSDLTRTAYVGKAPPRIKKWHQAILDAQSAAREHALGGMAAGEADAAARRLLRRKGLARYFVHGTGHGLGLEIHEAPRVGKSQKATLKPGMVITVEPGVYVEGVGGIRVEDELLITETGNEFLTDAARVLQEL